VYRYAPDRDPMYAQGVENGMNEWDRIVMAFLQIDEL
jgi:hypothetical protein